MSKPKPFDANELFQLITDKNEDFTMLDVRNEEEFGKFKVEAPYKKPMNIPYVDFTLDEKESVKKVPKDKEIKVICSKEGSAQYVAEILTNHGFRDVSYLSGGIKTWGNLLIPKLVNPDADYEFYQFIRPGKGCLNYGLIYKKEMMIFDPSRNIEFYKNFADEHGCKIIRTFETHLQADHISGSYRIAQETGAEFMANGIDFKDARFNYTTVQEGDTYTFSQDGPEIKVFHTPGHTPGLTSYMIDNKYLLTGDTLFISSIGRPDLGGKVEEWSSLLFNTLKTKIGPMDENLMIVPAHYMDWSEADENYIFIKPLKEVKERNANIFNLDSEEEFLQFIKKHIRKQPEVYDRIRKFNAGLLEEDAEEQEIMDIGKHECAATKS
jgi:glyoxylase-like metal-dependent hydrolase (beta-lactamase superfamily II)/rhodanese-related sulfurtransferase